MEFKKRSCGNNRIDQMYFYFPRRHHHSEREITSEMEVAPPYKTLKLAPELVGWWDGMEQNGSDP